MNWGVQPPNPPTIPILHLHAPIRFADAHIHHTKEKDGVFLLMFYLENYSISYAL